jgi:hypothetical protein
MKKKNGYSKKKNIWIEQFTLSYFRNKIRLEKQSLFTWELTGAPTESKRETISTLPFQAAEWSGVDLF